MLAPGGSIAVVSGLASLPQRIRCCLSLQRGESPFHPEFGTRFAQYYDAFRASPWLANLLKLEVIRQASIAYNDEVLGRQHTPLQSVGRVWSVDVLPEGPKAQWLSVRIDLDVQGVGRRQWVVSVFIPPNPGAAAPRPSMSDIAAGVRP
jgi:hypothetical protein